MFLLFFICILLSTIYLIYRNHKDNKLLRSVTQNGRGTWSERDLVIRLLKAGVSSDRIFHDLYIQKKDGSYSQVDIAVVTEVGVVVIEVKKYSGWIYGMGNREKWVQVLDYGKAKFPIYNPVYQNEGHIRAIKNQLPNYFNIPFYSLIVFYGNCKLKKISNIPIEVQVVKANKAIDAFSDILLKIPSSNFYYEEVLAVLKKGVGNGDDLEIQNKHVQNVSKKYNSI
jgi:hypothetical protein